ncbi:hypothetical protein FJZ31_33800 [Candidatus Poribacteria bacterium]|nr:hypothetical protein [Candidatus Poribacteria bacterium]
MKVRHLTDLAILTVLLFVLEFVWFAHAGVQSNPFAANPLAVTDPYVGTFKNDRITIEFRHADGQYTGIIHFSGHQFPATARESEGLLQGTFQSQGQNFAFTATLKGTTLTFTTGGATYTLEKQVINPLASIDNLEQPSSGHEQAQTHVQPQIQPGWSFEVTRSAGIKGTLSAQGEPAYPVRYFSKIIFLEQVNKVEAGRANEVTREVITAERQTIDEESQQTGELSRYELAPKGQTFRVVFSGDEPSLYDAKTNEEIFDDEVKEAFSGPLTPDLWPAVPLKAGQSWSYSDADLTRRLKLLDAQGGQMTLQVERIENQAETGLLTAYIRGQLQTRISFGPVPLDFNAKVEIDLPLAIGVPFMTKFEGALSGQGQVQDDMGQPINLTFSGECSALQGCKPSQSVLSAVGEVPHSTVPGETPPPPPQITPSGVIPKTGSKPQHTESHQGNVEAVIFQRVPEPREQAFTILVPKDWLVEGGILRIDPTAAGGPRQSIEAKVDLTVKRDSVGTVMIRQCPDWYFCDMRYSPAGQMGLFPPGSNYMGMTVSPVMTAQQFITQVVIPQAHPQARNVQVIEQRALPELAQRYQQQAASFAIPLQVRCDAAVLTLTYDEGGIQYKEKALALIEDRGALFAGEWLNRETRFFRAPVDEFDQWMPVFSVIQTSVKLNPQWWQGELKGQMERAGIVIKTLKELQELDRQITENRQKTMAEIHNDMFLTLTDQEEYINPYTNEVDVGSNQWKHRWVTEGGDIFYTDDDNFDPNRVSTLNRTDWKQSKVRPR